MSVTCPRCFPTLNHNQISFKEVAKDYDYDIVIRGTERRGIFEEDRDREHFLEGLSRLRQEMVMPCYAWTLMTDHVHLLLRTGTVPIARIAYAPTTDGLCCEVQSRFSGTDTGIFSKTAINRCLGKSTSS